VGGKCSTVSQNTPINAAADRSIFKWGIFPIRCRNGWNTGAVTAFARIAEATGFKHQEYLGAALKAETET
jgi:hypothetical protein